MKSTERRHLKENELVHTLVSLRAFLDARGRQITMGLIAVALVAVVAGVVVSMQGRRGSQGQDLLGEALVALNARVVPVGAQGADNVPAAAQLGATGTFSTEAEKLNAAIPKLETAAAAFPDSDAGVQARYYLAGALASVGRQEEALKAFDDVTRRAGSDSLYGRMARLGKADAQARAGQLDEAIAAWKTLASEEGAELPVDALLMELAQAYLQKGNTEEARKTFTQIVEQHPTSPYTSEARQELENLKS